VTTRKVLCLVPTILVIVSSFATNVFAQENSFTVSDTAALAEAPPKSAREGRWDLGKMGIGVKISPLGAGIEVATSLTQRSNLRGGFNVFQYNRTFTNDGVNYRGQIDFRSAEVHYDWFLFSGFHISPGLLIYNGNELKATASVPGGQIFTLSNTTYESDPANPLGGTGKLDFVKVSPTILAGFGNLIPRNGRRYSFLFEFGGAYQGSARVKLNFTGNVCDTSGLNCRDVTTDPTVQSNIQAQQTKIKNDISPYRFFPIVSFGFGFRF